MAMASQPNKQLVRVKWLVVLIFLVTCKSSSAVRPITGIPIAGGVGAPSAAEKYIAKPLHGGDETGLRLQGNNKRFLAMEKPAKLGGALGGLLMNALPKGQTPPSGPSKRSNDLPSKN